MNVTTQVDRQAQWKLLIEEHANSGKTQVAFCKEKNISHMQFGYYVKKFKSANLHKPIKQKHLFAPIQFKKSEPISTDIRVILPNGFQCTFSSDIDASRIKQLIEVLRAC